MPINAGAAVVIWSDTRTPDAWADWHSHEHLPERLALPGFLRGRRMQVVDEGLAPWFMLYEVEDACAMTSEAYLHSLNNPTEWSRRMMPNNLYLNRTLCRVAGGAAEGIGAFALPLVLDARPGREDALRQWLQEDVLPDLALSPVLTGARLMLNEDPRERPETGEEQLRGHRNLSVDGVLLLEGFDEDALRLMARNLAADWVAHGSAVSPPIQVYRLAHAMTKVDMGL